MAEPYTPEWWLDRLSDKLDERQRELELYEDYYSGEHRLTFNTAKFQQAFGTIFEGFADNWCQLVVDSVEERLNVEGFRYGTEKSGDSQAWDIWQANQLDAESQIAHTEALINKESFVLVQPNVDDPRYPRITVEHPSQVVVAYAAGDRRQRVAALKRWREDDGFMYAVLYLPDYLYKFRSKRPSRELTLRTDVRWDPWEPDNEAWPLPNTIGYVPVVPLVNRPSVVGEGVSEIRGVIPIQDAVNKLITDMLVASEFAAAPQRYATGLVMKVDETSGQPIPAFQHMVDRLWVSSKPDTNFGQFPQASLEPFVRGVEMLVQHIASQTRTPPHYFYLSGQFPSGESIKSAETGLVAKARRKMRHFGESWEEVMRLAFLVTGQKKRGQVLNAEVIWGDPESRSESEHIDAIVKKRALGVPLQQLWEDAGYSPQQIARFKDLLREESQFDLPAVAGSEQQVLTDAGVPTPPES